MLPGEHQIVGDRFQPPSEKQPPSKKRKLRQPRVARACEFCRRRKVRCSGTLPCQLCVDQEVDCTYDDQSATASKDGQTLPSRITFRPDEHIRDSSPVDPDPCDSRRPSLEPPQTFHEGHHIGPSAGVSFLFHAWNKGYEEPTIEVGSVHSRLVPLISHGDLVPYKAAASDLNDLPTVDEAKGLLERYFRFATPTYRFLHRPSLEEWTFKFLSGKSLPAAKTACVLLACAQSLLYTASGDRYSKEDRDLETSTIYYEGAKKILDHETGPASLASVQARLAMCLYLLSTFRINECRFCFSLANEILTSIGLHRKPTQSQAMDLVDSESRRRTFWCSYVLDGYLSVMLGRPRLLREEETDQPYPRNIDDLDMLCAESPDDLPLHGNLEAFIGHVELAKLIGRNNDLLYPLQPLSEQEVLACSNKMIRALNEWRDGLPGFLKPRPKTLVGQRTFERQNTVLKLAQAHLRILSTRQCLLSESGRLGRGKSTGANGIGALAPVSECLAGIRTIITTINDLIQSASMYQAFWFTQYMALVAISTLYVFLIQGARNALPAPLTAFDEIETLLAKAKQCQQYLAHIAPDGSQAHRYHMLLDRLQARVEKDLQRGEAVLTRDSILSPEQALEYSGVAASLCHHHMHSDLSDISERAGAFRSSIQPSTHVDIGSGRQGLDETSHNIIQFTPSDDGFTFQDILDLDWTSLDTLGNYNLS